MAEGDKEAQEVLIQLAVPEEKGNDTNASASVSKGQQYQDNDAETAKLLGAASRNDAKRILSLLRGGKVHASSADYDKRTALHLAASEGCITVVQLLVEEGAEVNLKDRFGFTPLDDALNNNQSEIVTFLRSAGAEHGSLSKLEGDFIQAAAEGKLEDVTRFLDSGVDPNAHDYDRRTALHLAVCEGNVAIAKLLMERGAKPDAEDRFGSSPRDEARRHAVRSGADHMAALLRVEGEEHGYFSVFTGVMLFAEIVMIILFFLCTTYDEKHAVGRVKGVNGTEVDIANELSAIAFMRKYPQFMDVHVMIFVGFGFLMTFLKKNAFQSLGLTFLCSAFAIQFHTLFGGLMAQVFHGTGFHAIELNLDTMILGDFSAGAVLITYGVLLGKVTPSQMMMVTFIETIFYTINEEIALTMGITDVGGSMVIHMFGAFFGLGASLLMRQKDASDNDNNASVYHSDVFAMIGTLFLWMYWPSFNGALTSEERQMRVCINTVLSLCGSCVAAFIFSHILRREGRFNMVDIQNATLAGGVAMGTSADLLIGGGGAFLTGFVGGAVSVAGYVYVQGFLEEKLGIHDTCGVNNLHGLPSLIGAIAGMIVIAAGDKENYGSQWGILFGQPDRTPSEQALNQFYYMIITLVISIVGGALCGLLVKSMPGLEKATMFMDDKYWEVPTLEMPYFFDHRGEIARGADSGSAGSNETKALDAKFTELENKLAIAESRRKDAAAPQFPGQPFAYPPPMYIQAPAAVAPAAPATDPKLMELMMGLITRLDAQEAALKSKSE